MASRIDSASSRRRGKRQSQRLSGSIAASCVSSIARELVGLGEHDLAVDRLDRPAGGDEPGGEPVEQLGMGRRFAAEPEVGRRGDDPPAEVVLPDPVDHDARRQGIVGLSQPLRQLEPSAALRPIQPAAARRPGMRTEGPRAGRRRPGLSGSPRRWKAASAGLPSVTA